MTADEQPGFVVLVIDDDPAIRFLVRENLETQGLVVEEAADGLAGIEMFRRVAPDLVLLDLMLPEMDGFEVCRGIRREDRDKPVPVLMFTALDDVQSIERAYRSGATDFATKPVNWSLLPHRVRYLIQANRAMTKAVENGARLEEAQRLAHIGSWEWDVSRDVLIWSDEVYRIFGIEPQRFEGRLESFLALVHPDDRLAVGAAVQRAMADGSTYALEHRIVRPDGVERHVQERARLVHDSDHQPLRMLGTVQDITERKRAEERIRHLAFYDELTGLPNRVFFRDQLEHALDLARRERCEVVVILLDLDHFRRINDTLGHGAGDQLLRQLGDAIRDCLRTSDYVARLGDLPHDPLARLGGDEFALMLPQVSGTLAAARVAGRVQECLARPVTVHGREIVVSASMGIASFPHDGTDADSLIKNADTAMYHAKQAGRGQYRYFSEDMQSGALERLSLEAELRRALEQGELELHFQPLFRIEDRALAGAEALLRWRHPERGLLLPDTFLPLVEQMGLLCDVGRWVLRESCRTLRRWDDLGLPTLPLSVNVSPQQFRDVALLDSVRSALDVYGIEGSRLELELTETALMSDADQTLDLLAALRELGVRLAIDDFGTGYSSLGYLRRFPIHTLKVDRSFVAGMNDSPDAGAIVSAVVNLARALDLLVVAEGVETESQLDALRALACDLTQGFLLGRPMPEEHFSSLLRAGAVPAPAC